MSVEEQREEGATELQSKIDSLTAILKSPTLAFGKPEGKEKKEQGKLCRKVGRGRVNPPQLLQWKEKDWELQQQVHQKVIKNLFNVTIVGDGDMDVENAHWRETSIWGSWAEPRSLQKWWKSAQNPAKSSHEIWKILILSRPLSQPRPHFSD